MEEQFYLFFPPFVLVAWRIGRRRLPRWSPGATVGGSLLVVTAVSFALSLWLTGAYPRLAFYGSPERAWEFAAGALLAVAAPAVGRVGRTTASVLAICGIGLIAVAAWRLTPATPFPGTAALLPVVGALLVIAAGTASTTWVGAVLATRPAVRIGDLSYGWYLWHWPVIVFARVVWPSAAWVLPLAGIASLAPAWLSYRIVENPIRVNPAVVGRRLLALTAACVVIPLACSAALLFGARAARSGDGVVGDITREYRNLHFDFVHRCNSLGSGAGDATCSWHPPGEARGTVVLVGDSNAGQFTEPLERAATGLSLDFVVATSPGCPIAEVEIQSDARVFTACQQYRDDVLGELERRPPDLLVVAAASPEYIEHESLSLRDPGTGRFVEDRDAKAEIWARGLRSVLERLDRAGVPTLVVHPIPYFAAWDLGLCPAFRLLTDVRDCGDSRSRPVAESYRRRAVGAERAAMAGLAGVRGLDLFDDLCSPESCRTNVGRVWIYRDRTHLSVTGALALTDRFTEQLRLRTAG